MTTATPPRAPLAAVVFDLDGTLVDSRQDLVGAVNALRGELGAAPLSLEQVVTMVGRGARVLVARALADVLPSSESEPFDRAFSRFLDLYLERCLDATRPYDGVREMLAALAGKVPLAVLTNKPERHTLKVLDGLDLLADTDARFELVLGGDSLETRKPDPEGLLLVARRLGAPIGRTLFVGDSAVDGETARAAGAPLALVTWGYGTAEELEPFAPVLRLETPAELLSFIRTPGDPGNS